MPQGTPAIGHQREGHQRPTRDVHGELISANRSPRTSAFVLFSILASAVFLCGCDVGSPEFQAIDAPPLHLVDATFYGADTNGATTTITLTPQNPAAAATDLVQTTSSIRLRFDRFLLPGEVIRQSLCLQALSDEVTTLEQCTQGVFLEPSYDPVRRSVTYRLPPMATLVADTRYWLTLLTPIADSNFGFRAFDGAALEQNLVLQFSTTKTNPPGGPLDPVLDDNAKRVISEELFCSASACVASCGMDDLCKGKCAVSKSLVVGCGGCHSAIENGGSAMGLDLSAPNRIPAIIGRVANQTQTGGNADQADLKSRRFGRAMPQIEPGDPGNSYLLYKMLISPIYARSTAAAGMAPGELDRLRASVVVGLPMPPYDLYAVPEAAVDGISAWITTGAATPACP